MVTGLPPPNEPERLRSLRRVALLDTPAAAVLDRLTQLAAQLVGVPIVLVSLVDQEREWFLATHGLAAADVLRAVAFGAHTILQDGLFLVPDAAQDPRFAANPLVSGRPQPAGPHA